MLINNQVSSGDHILSDTKRTTVNALGGTKFEDYMKALSSSTTTAIASVDDNPNKPKVAMDTNKGTVEMSLDDYFTPKSYANDSASLLDVPLLLPSAHNVDTLAKYSEKKLKGLMEQYDIPAPPATIEFDQQGQLVLPSDYPYAAELKHALNEQPQIEKALSATTALASHYAGIMEGQPFRDEMSTARTQADRERIAEKYSYLFDENRPPVHIVLSFLDDGSMLVGGRGGAAGSQTMFETQSLALTSRF